ncbi:MAG: hypothetical protein ACREI8_14765 [Myxococcota bacterium]
MCLAFCLAALGLAPPARATTVTVALTGEWFAVTDNANVTNGSIAVGGAFTVTLSYDDATADSDPSANTGAYFVPGASGSLTLETGDYTFTLLASETILIGIDDNVSGDDLLGLFAENFATSGPLIAGASTGYGYTNPTLFDSSQTAHSSDDLTDLPWAIDAYDAPGIYFFIEVLGKGPSKYIELTGEFTNLAVLPEPSMLALGAVLLLVLARVRRVH